MVLIMDIDRRGGEIMAKKRAKAQKWAKRGRGNSAKRNKPRKASKLARAKATKRTVIKAKPKRGAPVKKTARKVKAPVAPVVETVIVDVIEQPAPGVISVTEVEETRQVN